jgi:hypothetical protein
MPDSDASNVFIDWEIGMRESGGPELAALGDLL